jgi:hypothetical protein
LIESLIISRVVGWLAVVSVDGSVPHRGAMFARRTLWARLWLC